MNGFAGFSKIEWRLVLQTRERLSCMTPSVIVLSGVVKDTTITTSQATWLLSMGKKPMTTAGPRTSVAGIDWQTLRKVVITALRKVNDLVQEDGEIFNISNNLTLLISWKVEIQIKKWFTIFGCVLCSTFCIFRCSCVQPWLERSQNFSSCFCFCPIMTLREFVTRNQATKCYPKVPEIAMPRENRL
jgi:hypothetical protein